MNILDEAENDNPAPDVDKEEDTDYFYCNDEMLNDEHDSAAEDETEDPDVRNKKFKYFFMILVQLVDWQRLIYLLLIDLYRWMT